MKIVIFFSLLFTLNARAEINREWEDYSDPSIRGANFERMLARLPLAGQPVMSGKLWASDYWSRKKGSINRRWNTRDQIGFKLVSPTRDEAHAMSIEQLATLSATEKLDLLNADYSYSLVQEVDKIADEHAELWHGICNGWAPAAQNHKEPTPKTLTSTDGVQVPFGSSDIKALLSYYYAYHSDATTTHQMGKRCFLIFGPGCDEDLNAGAFHIVLANTVGIQKQSFIADVERGRQVWNHNIVGYTSVITEDNMEPAHDSAPGTVKRVRVKTDMTYVAGITANSWNPTNGTPAHENDVKHYEYILDVDYAGRIVGGEWKSKARPDFIWSMDKATSFKGNWARLSELLND
ncbi:MAG: hypothetical protein ACJ76H_04355 [Bacteriovoracaceae bacterium]